MRAAEPYDPMIIGTAAKPCRMRRKPPAAANEPGNGTGRERTTRGGRALRRLYDEAKPSPRGRRDDGG